MRLVSADRRYDVQYENVMVVEKNRQVWANNLCMAEYHTKEEALEAMQDIRNTYAIGQKFFYF